MSKKFNLTIIDDGNEKTVAVCENEKVMNALVSEGVVLLAPCGGLGKCGKCLVKVLSGSYRGGEVKNGYILACKAEITGDLKIEIPKAVGSGVDFSSLERENVNSGFTGGFINAAVDIGTTTIAVYLLSENGAEISKKTVLNPEGAFGADVLSRINAAANGKQQEMFSLVTGIIEKTLIELNSTNAKIKKVAVAGNTTMLHLFLNVSPEGMGKYPFTPEFLCEKIVSGESVNISAETVVLLPGISAFVGADITAGIYSAGLTKSDGLALIDVGTNGEMAVVKSGVVYCCSTAAGPALEGANIEMGSGGINGAIDRVSFVNGKFQCTTIGGSEAKSICGSGLIDAISLFKELGYIDETGLIVKATADNKIYLTDNVYISQADIRQVQLAKSAIIAGFLTLISEAGLKLSDIKTLYLAGGLGFYLNVNAAVNIRLLPKELLNRIVAAGNTAGLGAKAVACSDNALEEMKQAIKNAKNIDLSVNPMFMDEYIENMEF